MSMMSSTRITPAYEKQKRTAKNSVQRRSIVDALSFASKSEHGPIYNWFTLEQEVVETVSSRRTSLMWNAEISAENKLKYSDINECLPHNQKHISNIERFVFYVGLLHNSKLLRRRIHKQALFLDHASCSQNVAISTVKRDRESVSLIFREVQLD